MARTRRSAIVDSPVQPAQIITAAAALTLGVIPPELNSFQRLTSKECGPHGHMGRNFPASPLTQIISSERSKRRAPAELLHQRSNTMRLKHNVIIHEH